MAQDESIQQYIHVVPGLDLTGNLDPARAMMPNSGADGLCHTKLLPVPDVFTLKRNK